MDLTDLLKAASDCGIADAGVVRQLARPAAVLRPDDAGQPSVCQSHIGGMPSLPSAIEWPRRDGRSLAFIAEIDLASQPEALGKDGFPTDGTLLFFYEAEQSTWGFDPKDAGSFAVIHIDTPDPGAPRDWPSDVLSHARYGRVPLIPETTTLLPPWESVLIADLKLSDEELNAYQNLLERTSDEQDWTSRSSAGTAANNDPRLPTFRRQARNWRLLLQVPSMDAAGMMWGDAGCLYYWIQEDDLRARRFDRSWMILQCS